MGGDLFHAVGHGGEAFVVEFEAFDEGGIHLGFLGGGDIFGVGGEEDIAIGADGGRDFFEDGGFYIAAQARQLAGRFPGGFAEIQDIFREILHCGILAN